MGIHSKKLWTAMGIMMVIWVIAMLSGYFFLLRKNTLREAEYSSYDYHIAIISEETDTSFWQDVYLGAVEAGAGYGAYVEQVGDGLVDRFSMEDAINIAIYERVDGILLRPSEEGRIQKMIDKACSHGIPVITMQKDVPDSKRQGFVGINDYFLGQEYGKRVLKTADADTRLVTVLFPGTSFNETSRKWFRLGLSNTVPQEQIQFDFRIIRDDKGLNNAEDVIHDIAKGNMQQPDIIICLDEVITQSTYHLIRDQGLSEKVKVIGSYISEDIIEGIEQGYIDSTITIDPEAMGRMSIDALMTYKQYHMVSYYTEVDTMLVDRTLAAEYRREMEDEEEPDRE
ncbi:MAG: sugar ABC transporter substrate-binding protein [Lachnospiraceae bacterium]|jgi:ribose transport system substrate-binding protein|nr:sugar ABC transporter substrate-binding protein [Lachnospiraceae bacterium]